MPATATRQQQQPFYSNGRLDCRIYVGNLPNDCQETDLDELFFKFGQINYINIKKTISGGVFAFIEFEDPRDAEDAVYSRHRYQFNGSSLRVEFCRGGRALTRSIGPNDRVGTDCEEEEYRCSRIPGSGYRTAPPGRRSDYRVLVYDLPVDASWEDLKLHMREAGCVCFAEIARDGTGIVEYERYDDMRWAVHNLDNSYFETSEGGMTSHIAVQADPKSLFSDLSPVRTKRRSPQRKAVQRRKRSPSSAGSVDRCKRFRSRSSGGRSSVSSLSSREHSCPKKSSTCLDGWTV